MNNLYKYFLKGIFFFLFFIITERVMSYSPLLLNDHQTDYTLIQNIALLEDEEGSLTFEEILKKDKEFMYPVKNTSMGITTSTWWVKVEIQNNSSQSEWYLEAGAPYIYGIDLYKQNSASQYEMIPGGTKIVLNQRKVKSNKMIFPLDIPIGERKVFYLKYKSRMYMNIQLSLASMQKVYESNQKQDIISGLYFGLLIALMTYNLFVFISLRDLTYLFYVLYTFFLGLHMATLKGYGIEFLWPTIVWLNNVNIFVSLAIFFAILFTNYFLHAKEIAPRLYKFQWIVIVILIIGLILNFLGYYSQGFLLIAFNPAYIYYVFMMGVSVYRRGFDPAKYYILGFGVLVVEIMAFNLLKLGLFNFGVFSTHSLEIGSSIEAVVLSFALANKFQFYKKEKELAHALAIMQAKQFSHNLINTQESEREKIAAELHNSIGQSLILIKNRVLLIDKEVNNKESVFPLNDLSEMVSDTIQEIRTISYDLRPFQLDLLGLTQSVKELINDVEESSNISFTTEIQNIDGVFSKDGEINLYRVIQECLNNIVKHSGTEDGTVRIVRSRSFVELLIEDYGRGMGNKIEMMNRDIRQGFGLVGIKERINILKGSLIYEKAFPHGTSVKIHLPIINYGID